MKLPVFRVRALDKELAEMLIEADGRCATEFALRLDDLRQKLAPSIISISKSEARILRRNADQDGKGNPKPEESGRALRFSTADQQERLGDELDALCASEIDVDDSLPRIKKSELYANGLGMSGQRIANLRPILEVGLDEPGGRAIDERTIHIGAPGRIPNA